MCFGRIIQGSQLRERATHTYTLASTARSTHVRTPRRTRVRTKAQWYQWYTCTMARARVRTYVRTYSLEVHRRRRTGAVQLARQVVLVCVATNGRGTYVRTYVHTSTYYGTYSRTYTYMQYRAWYSSTVHRVLRTCARTYVRTRTYHGTLVRTVHRVPFWFINWGITLHPVWLIHRCRVDRDVFYADSARCTC